MSGLHTKRLHWDTDSFIVWCGPKDNRYQPSLGIHIDFPWSEDVRQFDCPKRINLHLWNWHVMIGLTKDAKSQSWNHKEGNTERWRWVTWHPNHRKLCCHAPVHGSKFGGRIRDWECGRLKGHKGDHA